MFLDVEIYALVIYTNIAEKDHSSDLPSTVNITSTDFWLAIKLYYYEFRSYVYTYVYTF